MRLTILILTAALAFCADPPKPVVTKPPDFGKPIAEIHMVKLENITLRVQILQQEADRLDAQRADIIKVICSDASLELKACDVDLKNKVVRTKPKPEPKK